MKSYPSGDQPEQLEAEDVAADFAEYEDQPTQHIPAQQPRQTSPLADQETQRIPAVTGALAASPPPASFRQSDLQDQPTKAADPIADLETHVLPSVPVSRPPARTTTARPRPNQTVRRRRRATRRTTRFPVSPWVMRLALVLGLVILGVRAASASQTFMEAGGYIIGWSRLPVTHCVVCRVPQPTGQVPLTAEQYAHLLVSKMTLDEKLGQMLIVQFTGLEPTPDAVQMINAQGAGGILYFAANISSVKQIQSLNAQVQQMSSIPVLTSIDQEGGTVNRLRSLYGPLPSASSLADPAAAEARGQQDAELLANLGFNLNLAPVVDVGTANPQLYERTFGTDPARVAAMAGAYLEGLQQSGKVSGTLKHFPGLGDTTTDPHMGLPILYRSKADWEAIDLAPYRALLQGSDVRSIMVTHVMIPAVDNTYPASLSPALINGVLRGELGFDGVVITDSLYMGALNTRWSVPQAAVLAIKAGADMVIGPSDPQMVAQVIEALKQALVDGTLSQASIDTSVSRILTLKIQTGLISIPHQ
jgi:beta-glucosidase-like glycosyl hydrolase